MMSPLQLKLDTARNVGVGGAINGPCHIIIDGLRYDATNADLVVVKDWFMSQTDLARTIWVIVDINGEHNLKYGYFKTSLSCLAYIKRELDQNRREGADSMFEPKEVQFHSYLEEGEMP